MKDTRTETYEREAGFLEGPVTTVYEFLPGQDKPFRAVAIYPDDGSQLKAIDEDETIMWLSDDQANGKRTQ